MRCGRKSGIASSGVTKPKYWLRVLPKCRFAGLRTNRSARMRPELACAMERPVYECLYLALGHRLGATLVTADQCYAENVAAAGHGGAIMALEDFEAGMQ